MQVIKLNDLKRMKITDLAKMAHDFGIEGYQGLKKQDLIFALLSGIADKKFEVHAEGVMELLERRLRLPAQRGQRLPAEPGRHLRLAVAGAPLQPAAGRHGDGPHPPAARGRALLRAAEGGQDQLRRPAVRGGPRAHPLRQPHAALPDPQAQAGARGVGDDHAHHRHVLPHRPGPALPHRGAAEGGQDGAAAEHRARHRARTTRTSTSSCCSWTSGPRK